MVIAKKLVLFIGNIKKYSIQKTGGINDKKTIFEILIAVTGLYFLWRLFIPVEIIAVHEGKILLVRNFPYLKSRQIAWWEANKNEIKKRYDIPHKDDEGQYDVYIQDFGKGYRIDSRTDEDSDLLCFDDMKVAASCIEKAPLLWIGSSRNIKQYYRQ